MESKAYPQYNGQYGTDTAYSHLYNGPQTQTTAMEETVTVPKTEEYSFEEPPATVHSTHRRRKYFVWLARYIGIIVVVGVILLTPVLAYRMDADQSENDDLSIEQRQYNNLIFYVFLWLVITWVCGCLVDIIALSLPYLFRLIARYVNPAHLRYWRTLRAMRFPLVLLGTMFSSYVSFTLLIPNNLYLSVNFNKPDDYFGWDDVIDDIHFVAALWVSFYFVLKIAFLYITIHHHTRSNCKRIAQSKEMHNALVALYDASLYLHPVGSKAFEAEDAIIRSAKGLAGGSARKRVTTYLSKMGVDSYGMTSFFGNFFSDDPKSHWMKPASSYAVVERAIAGPKSAAALSKRIWMSLTMSGNDGLTAKDIAEVLGPYRAEEAKEIFKILDVNESGDLRLDELIWTVVEAGHVRHHIYQSMHDADHCINTFNWVCLTILALVMVFVILIAYVPTIKAIQSTLSFVALGLSFAVGRTFHHFLVGVVYVFFDHPFDIGDRVEIYNLQASNQVSAIVTRQSLLYTCFRRLDNGLELQIQNERLSFKRIENVSRSGLNRQSLSIFVDIRTTFKDIMYLKSELIEFLTDSENRRDFQPDLGLSIVSLHELNKLEIKLNVGHKSNWSNEKLRATRSNRFMCALLATLRKVPIYKPGAMNGTAGDPEKPIYHAWINDAEATGKIAAGKTTREAKRYDAPHSEESEKSTAGERDAAAEEAAAKKAAKAAADAAAEENAFTRMTVIPAFPPALGVKDSGKSSALEVEQLVSSTATGLRQVPNNGGNAWHGQQ